jgi:hypothetical protein
MKYFAIAGLVAICAASGVQADQFAQVQTRADFMNLLDGRELRRVGIRLTVSSNGQISGGAFGGTVTGDWQWAGGYFCRDLYYNEEPLDLNNCQRVDVDNDGDVMRFTSDRGTGDSANFRLR